MEPKSPQPQTQTKRRLKDSCNSCGITKVKCNKEKPKCSRCEERGIFCHYSPSQRSGRRSAASSASTAPTTKPILLPNNKAKSETNQRPPSSKSSTPGSSEASYSSISQKIALDNVSHDLEKQSFESLGMDDNNFNSTLISPVSFDALDTSSLDFLDSGFSGSDVFASLKPDVYSSFLGDMNLPQPIAPLTPASLYDPSQSAVLESKGGLVDQTHSCLTLALNILPMLHIPPSSCTTSPSAGGGINQSLYPTFDYVISTNKAIIEMMSNILNCSCSLDEQLASILSLIAFKVMAWYSAAAKEVDGETSYGNLSPSSERVLHLPVMVGRYRLDGRDASWLRAQLILSELQRMTRLVTLLSKRFEEVQYQSVAPVTSDGQESKTRSRWLSSSIFSQLETDLKKRLQSVTEETTSILRGNQMRS